MKATEEEIVALKQNYTQDMVLNLKGVKQIYCKYVYKKAPKQLVERYKARLVTQGFAQQYMLDYEETFNSMATLTIVRVLLALKASKEWKLWQIYRKNAFSQRIRLRDLYESRKRI